MEIFNGYFKSKEDIAEQFNVDLGDETEIIYADYFGSDTCDAWVIFEEEEEIYEVFGGHCSCNGLEGQWCPERTSIEDILHRIERGGQSDFDTDSVVEILNHRKKSRLLFKDYRDNLANFLTENNVVFDFVETEEYHEGYATIHYYYANLDDLKKLRLDIYEKLPKTNIGIIRIFIG